MVVAAYSAVTKDAAIAFPYGEGRPEAPQQVAPATARPLKIIPGRDYWRTPAPSVVREYAEVFAVIAAITVAGWFVPVSYRAFGSVYLLMVIVLSLRVGRGPVLAAAVVSALAWNYVFMPSRLAFAVPGFDDALMLSTYFVAALIGGQLTARIRAEERQQRKLEQRASALFHLTRALTAAQTLDDAAEAALRQADDLFNARTALHLVRSPGGLAPHAAGSLQFGDHELAVAERARATGRPAGRFADDTASGECLHVPLLRGAAVVGVLSLSLRDDLVRLSSAQRDLIDGFAAQIALLIEREQLRAAGEREKLLAESDRLHRTLLDSVSHELKTPLSVLRTAAEKLDTGDEKKRAALVGEVRTATRRLDHLVANLLNQTRIESGSMRPQLDWCDAHDLVGAARRALGDALAGHRVTIELPAELPLFHCDAALMEQALANLLLNAAHHTPAGGLIRVAAGVEAGREYVFIAVADSGPGIPPEMQAGLFQKFRRGPNARTGGLGLGLSIVRGFMLAQGGDVTAGRSSEGGACFTVHLPHSTHDRVPGDDH